MRAGTPDAAAANRLFYEEYAASYDSTEDFVTNPRTRALLWAVLRDALTMTPSADPRVLDACGGSGHASAMLVELGAPPVTVDISPEMLAQWRGKAARLGYQAKTVEGEIGEFLSTNQEQWDLIVFSSALHHLEDYCEVVRLAARRLVPGGVLVTIFDPLRATRTAGLVRRLDYAVEVLARSPREFLRKLRRRLLRTGTEEPNLGALAELHAMTGIDDQAVRQALESEGMEVVEHVRSPEAHFALFRGLLRALRSPSGVRFIARKADPERAA